MQGDVLRADEVLARGEVTRDGKGDPVLVHCGEGELSVADRGRDFVNLIWYSKGRDEHHVAV
jgi:hypothetical protein